MKTKPKKPKALNWKPVLNGDVYCAPACGAGCTWDAYARAQGRAQRLTKALGPKFKPTVWENMGWHYKAECGEIQVYPPERRSGFSATLGNNFWVEATTPKAAVKALLKEYEQILSDDLDKIRALKRALGDPGFMPRHLKLKYAGAELGRFILEQKGK